MVTFQKISWQNLPDVYRDAVISFTNDEIIFDDVKVAALTQNQRDRGLEWLQANGYKQV